MYDHIVRECTCLDLYDVSTVGSAIRLANHDGHGVSLLDDPTISIVTRADRDGGLRIVDTLWILHSLLVGVLTCNLGVAVVPLGILVFREVAVVAVGILALLLCPVLKLGLVLEPLIVDVLGTVILKVGRANHSNPVTDTELGSLTIESDGFLASDLRDTEFLRSACGRSARVAVVDGDLVIVFTTIVRGGPSEHVGTVSEVCDLCGRVVKILERACTRRTDDGPFAHARRCGSASEVVVCSAYDGVLARIGLDLVIVDRDIRIVHTSERLVVDAVDSPLVTVSVGVERNVLDKGGRVIGAYNGARSLGHSPRSVLDGVGGHVERGELLSRQDDLVDVA